MIEYNVNCWIWLNTYRLLNMIEYILNIEHDLINVYWWTITYIYLYSTPSGLPSMMNRHILLFWGTQLMTLHSYITILSIYTNKIDILVLNQVYGKIWFSGFHPICPVSRAKETCNILVYNFLSLPPPPSLINFVHTSHITPCCKILS